MATSDYKITGNPGQRSCRLSVIIPARDEEAYIADTIRSVKAQDFEYCEIIVVDNGSTDRTSEIAGELGCTVVYEPQPGLPLARERGRKAARGDILVYFDADMLMPGGYLSRISAHFRQKPDCVALSNPFLFSDGSWILRTLVSLCFHFLYRPCMKVLKWLHCPTILFGGNFAVQSWAVEQIGGFDTRIEFFGEDVHFSKRISKAGPVDFLNDLYTLTSARRYIKDGFLRTYLLYLINIITILWLDRAFTMPAVNVKKSLRYATAVSLISVLLYALSCPTSEIFGKVIHHMKGTQKVLALTFDDGPNGNSTLRVLDTLEQEHVKATFFLIGKNVEKYPDIAREIVRRGHRVGNHSYTHPWKLPFEKQNAIVNELDMTQTAIFVSTGVRTTLFRPPHGLRTPWMLGAIKKRGYQVITWDDMTTDYIKSSRPDSICRKIVSKARPGSIVVLHDGLDLNHGIERDNTDDALISIIRALKSKGYQFTTLN